MSFVLNSASLNPAIQLTSTSISSLLSFPPIPSYIYQTDHILQILQLKYHSIIKFGTPQIIYTASLKDTKYHYNKFVLFCNNKSTPSSEGDYIRIKRLQVITLPKDPDIVLLIKDYINLETRSTIAESSLYGNAKNDVRCEDNSTSTSNSNVSGITLLK